MNFAQKTVDYFKSSKEEFKKVSWPSRQDTFRYSALVISISLVVAAFFAGLDLGFTKLVESGVAYRSALQARQQIQLPEVTATSSPSITPTSSASINLNNASPLNTPTSTPSATSSK